MDVLVTLWHTFFDWPSMREALPEMLSVGVPNTLILALSSAVLGTVIGMLLAVAGVARTRWLRWPARVYTDVFRGLPVVVTILLVGATPVLRGVDLDVPSGRSACVIGPSGSGKSTLLRVMNRLLEPDQGDVLLDGQSVLSWNPDHLRRQVGMVFQHFNLFPHKTVRHNVTLALRKLKGLSAAQADDVALRHLDRVGLRDKADQRPGNLSGGQQQRVAIARALAMSPRAMLFDEVTSALDPELVKGVLSLLADLAQQGMTMIVVTHEMGFARRVADQVVFMDRGRVVEAGPPDAVFAAPASPRLRHFLAQVL